MVAYREMLAPHKISQKKHSVR